MKLYIQMQINCHFYAQPRGRDDVKKTRSAQRAKVLFPFSCCHLFVFESVNEAIRCVGGIQRCALRKSDVMPGFHEVIIGLLM